MIRQRFTESANTHLPGPRLRQRLLIFLSDRIFRHFMHITGPVAAALVTEPPDIIPLLAIQIAKSGNIDPVRPPPKIILVLIPFHHSAGPYPEMMIHQVMT